VLPSNHWEGIIVKTIDNKQSTLTIDNIPTKDNDELLKKSEY